MRDGDVRTALHARLAAEHLGQRDTLTLDELSLCGQVRVDVAVVNGYFSGYELKSECDTLRRLPAQVDVYSRVLDFVTLVVADRHQGLAVEMIPDWWGVIVAAQDAEGDTVLELDREGSINPEVDPLSLVQLLWRDEALAELDDLGCAEGVRSKPRPAVWQRLVDELGVDGVRSVVRARLKARQGWRVDP